MSIVEDLKQLGARNPRGTGARPAKTVAIEIDMANAARSIAEKHRVTINFVVSYAILRLTQEIEAGILFARVPPATLEAVKRESARRGMVPSALVREALDLLLKDAVERLAAA
jgi:hypothetical protein